MSSPMKSRPSLGALSHHRFFRSPPQRRSAPVGLHRLRPVPLAGRYYYHRIRPEIQDTEILLNGAVSKAPVSRFVVEKLAKEPVRVKTELEMPFGAGFGASGAGRWGAPMP